MADLFSSGDVIVKVLSVGASGLALLLAILCYRLIGQPAEGTGPERVELYKARLKSVNFFIVIALVIFIVSLVGQFFLDRRKAAVELTIQEVSALVKFRKDYKLEPIRIKHRAAIRELPTSKDEDRLELLLSANDHVDISLSSLIDHIAQQSALLSEKDRQLTERTKQGGFDEAR
jgi:hypothetical protein